MSEGEANTVTSNTRLSLRWPWLTVLMMLVLIGAYVWAARQAGSYGPYDITMLTELGGSVSVLSATGDYANLWRSLFLHESIEHLTQNLMALLVVGAVLESLVRRSLWLLVYLAGGLFSAWVSALWHFDYTQMTMLGYARQVVYVSVGASGAILALAGAELAMAVQAYRNRDESGRQVDLLRGALVVPVMTLGLGLLDTGVDHAAHFGGFGFGLLVGIALAVWQETHKRGLTAVWALVTVALVGGTVWLGHAYVQAHPKRDELRQTAIDLQAEKMQELAYKRRLKSEPENLPPAATPEEAQGTVIDQTFVGRVVPTQQPGRVYMLKNFDEAEVFDYDLDAGKVASSFMYDYPKDQTWGCPGKQCERIGVTDMALLPDQPGKAFFSNLVAEEVSRVDLATGKTELSVHTGSFPMRLLVHQDRLYVHDMADATVTVLDAENGEVLRVFALEGVEGTTRFWEDGDSMALSKDQRRIYVLSHTGQVHVLDLAKQTMKPWEAPVEDEQPEPPEGQTIFEYLKQAAARYDAQQTDVVRRIGTDGQGNVWLLHQDGVSYPDGHAPRRQVYYKLPRRYNTLRSNIRDAFIDPDGDQGLILLLVDNYVLASSAHTGQLLRVYPLAVPASSVIVLDVLDNQHFYVAGREGMQIFDVDKALRVDPIATDYQRVLKEERKKRD